MHKVLVTGAAGFIGCHVVRELLAADIDVRALVRPGEGTINLRGLAIEIVEGDLCDAAAMGRVTEGVDTVFHLAAIYAIWMRDWRQIYDVNLQGSRNVLWACLRNGVQRVVFTSSIAAIGIAPGRQLSDERTPFNQHELGSHYVLTKHLSQQEALTFADSGLDVVVVNPAFPFGPRDVAPTPTGKIILDIAAGKNRFTFGGGVNIVDVRDVARGHLLAASKGRRGELYILGNRNVTMTELRELVCRAAGRDPRLALHLPVRLASVAAGALTWWADRVSHRPPLSTPVEIRYSSEYLFFDNSKACRELGLTFTPVERSIADAVDWFRANGYLD